MRPSSVRVVVTDCDLEDAGVAEEVLAAVGAEVVRGQCSSEEEVIELVDGAPAVLVQFAPITARVLASCPSVRCIARYGTGVDNIDLEAATARGVAVCNVPDYCVSEVADHTMALLLAFARKTWLLDQSVRSGQWSAFSAGPIHRLSGQVLGLAGFGRIARAVAQRAKAFGLSVWAYDPYVSAEAIHAAGVRPVGWIDLLSGSDYLSLHLPASDETRGLINGEALRRMKPTAVLINTARGSLICEEDLAEAIRSGVIAGAALDVLGTEPPRPDHPLFSLPHVILTPHAAYYSEESLQQLLRTPPEEVVRFLTGEPLRFCVNPEVLAR